MLCYLKTYKTNVCSIPKIDLLQQAFTTKYYMNPWYTYLGQQMRYVQIFILLAMPQRASVLRSTGSSTAIFPSRDTLRCLLNREHVLAAPAVPSMRFNMDDEP